MPRGSHRPPRAVAAPSGESRQPALRQVLPNVGDQPVDGSDADRRVQHERLHRVERAGLLALVDGPVEAGASSLVDAGPAEAVLLLELVEPALVGERERQLLTGDAEVAGGAAQRRQADLLGDRRGSADAFWP